MSKLRIEGYVIIIRSWLCTKWDVTSKTYQVTRFQSGFMGSWTNANHILRDNRSSEVIEGVCHTGVIIELYQFTSVSGRFYHNFLWQSITIYLRLSILWSCRSHSWFLAAWAFDITAISFWSMNNIMNNILAPLSKHMIYAGICVTLNLIEKIGYSSSGRKTCTISFWVILDSWLF